MNLAVNTSAEARGMGRMPRFAERAVWLSAIALGCLALAGVVWGWTSWRSSAGLVARGTSAYAQRDFRQAADLARRRLKDAPEDVEALRLLARATARLGRDAPANALFARLGSAALQAEDLYLLGLGLNHVGQKESAGKVWEKGLAIDPDHAEMIEQLMMLDAARSRVAEAARLAEQLAKQPQWELRGELAVGNFRAEMSDPAGAAATLRKALERPEASRLDRSQATYYRELLARSLLKIERPGEARDVLQTVLDHRPDSAAHWLQSRVALQEGAISEAIAAIRAAGSYRAEHPLELEPGPYVGESRCAQCHSDKASNFQASRHASTLVRGKGLLKIPYPDGVVADPDDATVTHAFRREGDQVHYQTRVKDEVRDAIVDYAFGSPDHYVSIVGHDNEDRRYIFRLSRFQTDHDAGWVRTTGHSADAQGGHDFLGKPIDGIDGLFKCLFCHATDPRAVLDHSGPVAADRAIGCERCHGPGGNHVRAVEAKLTDMAIVNPAAAPAEGRLRVCGQCHSNHLESPLPRTDPFWLRFQGNTIAWSRCYTESAGSFDCMTCHDPHHDNDRSAAQHNARCLICHAARTPDADATRTAPSNPKPERNFRGATCPVQPADGCIGCHMPSIKSQPLHATFTDHYIRVHRDATPATSK
jgi:tetratricopeptide (TPR) repeat protein